MRQKIAVLTCVALAFLAGCNNNQEGAQPEMGNPTGHVNSENNRMKTSNAEQPFDHPYNHNYNGHYTGEQDPSTLNDLRSAQQVAARAREAAEKVPSVDRAVAMAQGIDIVVGIEIDNTNDEIKSIEDRVNQAITQSEQGYNVYVTADPEISERIHTLFSNMINVKTSNVTHGIGEIIYDIGQANGR